MDRRLWRFGIAGIQAPGERLAERREGFVHVPLARDDAHGAFFEVGQCAEAVIFLEQLVRVVEGRAQSGAWWMILGIGNQFSWAELG